MFSVFVVWESALFPSTSPKVPSRYTPAADTFADRDAHICPHRKPLKQRKEHSHNTFICIQESSCGMHAKQPSVEQTKFQNIHAKLVQKHRRSTSSVVLFSRNSAHAQHTLFHETGCLPACQSEKNDTIGFVPSKNSPQRKGKLMVAFVLRPSTPHVNQQPTDEHTARHHRDCGMPRVKKSNLFIFFTSSRFCGNGSPLVSGSMSSIGPEIAGRIPNINNGRNCLYTAWKSIPLINFQRYRVKNIVP